MGERCDDGYRIRKHFVERKTFCYCGLVLQGIYGLLFPVSLPGILGYSTPPNVNIGDVQNTGINLTLGSKGNFSKNFGWNINVALTTYKSKVS